MGFFNNIINPCKHVWTVVKKEQEGTLFIVIQRCSKCGTIKKDVV